MSNLPTLLRRHKELFKQFLELEREIADLDRQIIAAGTPPRAITKAPPRRISRPSAANGGVGETVRETVRVLQVAGAPLAPRELAARMGVEPKVASRYLAQALKLRLVEHVDQGRYRVSSVVPTLEARDARSV